jgi:hypothetical protein
MSGLVPVACAISALVVHAPRWSGTPSFTAANTACDTQYDVANARATADEGGAGADSLA